MTTNLYTKNTILSDEEEDKLSRENTDKWLFRILLLVIAILPLLIGGAVREVISPQISSIGQITTGIKGDIYTYYKSIFLITLTTIAVALYISKILFMNGEIRKTKLNIFVGIFILAILVSTIFSPNSTIALWGKFNRSEGALSYLCYTILFFIAINIKYPKSAFSKIMYSLYPFVFINFFTITMNFVGNDLLKYPVVQSFLSLFLPESSFLGNESILIGTLNQWNYMSGMFAVMTVMYLTWAIHDLNKTRSIVNLFVSLISLSIMLMSLSTSGFLTLILIIPLLIYISFKTKNSKKAFVVLIAFIIISLPIFHILAKKNPNVWTESFGFVIKENPYFPAQQSVSNHFDFHVNTSEIVYAAENSFELPVLPPSKFSPGTGRTYIWDKTLKLLRERPLFGYGLDTLMYHFPHYNIDARGGVETEHTIVDKPHNMFIGVLYGTGIVGFIGFMSLVVITSLSALQAILKNRDKSFTIVLSIGWLAFLIQALFNDSLPGTAAPMWTLAGIMMAFLLTTKEKNNLQSG